MQRLREAKKEQLRCQLHTSKPCIRLAIVAAVRICISSANRRLARVFCMAVCGLALLYELQGDAQLWQLRDFLLRGVQLREAAQQRQEG